MLDRVFNRIWYGRSIIAIALLPLSLLFAGVVATRRTLYRIGALKTVTVPRPVIVVGNISVGGTGKTPLVIWMTQALRNHGYRPGIVTRGYGGNARNWPQEVGAGSDPNAVGDEAVLLAERTNSIVVAGPDRVQSARRAIELGADIIISDDGLQHYCLARDVEIAVIDGERGFGNGFLLPAGPLREGVRRLRSLDAIVRNYREKSTNRDDQRDDRTAFPMQAKIAEAVSLIDGERRQLSRFAGETVHAVAGIGNPQAFFDALTEAGLKLEAHPLRDHARIARSDLEFGDRAPVLMTEKDAVKCRAFAEKRFWSVPLTIELHNEEGLLAKILPKLDSKHRAAHS